MNDDVTNDPKFFENLQDEILKKFYTEVERIAEKIGLILQREVQDVLKSNDKYATGDAYKSVSYEVEKLTGEYLIKCFLGVNYGVFIYDGTKPHFPPIEPIMKWVKIKGIGQSFSIKSHRMVGSKFKPVSIRQQRSQAFKAYPGKKIKSEDKYSSQVRSIAYAIAKKISRKGTAGIKFFDLALKQATPYIENELKSLGTIQLN